MGKEIPESDWKVFRKVRVDVLSRFYERILSEVARLANDTSTSSPERYHLVYELIKQRDDDIAEAFNDARRSTAILQLMIMHRRGLLTPEEFARFSAETQQLARSLAEIH